MKKTVLVGMSGGVDSSAAAAILSKDYNVIGVTLKLHGDCSEAVADAAKVCEKLGIKHYAEDYSCDFKQYVIDNFIDEYVNARTPNPCVWCNYHIKFGVMHELAKEMGADYVATGHYVSRAYDEALGEYILKAAEYGEKDQTYALYRLRQSQLERALFPLGSLPKERVRDIARELGLAVADKKDSQEICFVPDNDYASYIENAVGKSKPGKFIGPDGQVLGEHKGLIHYTVGQRRGLGIAYSERLYVARLDIESNTVHLGVEGVQYVDKVTAHSPTFISERECKKEFDCLAKIRYNGRGEKAHAILHGDGLTVTFEKPVRAAAPGQSVVLYDGERLLGGGIINP